MSPGSAFLAVVQYTMSVMPKNTSAQTHDLAAAAGECANVYRHAVEVLADSGLKAILSESLSRRAAALSELDRALQSLSGSTAGPAADMVSLRTAAVRVGGAHDHGGVVKRCRLADERVLEKSSPLVGADVLPARVHWAVAQVDQESELMVVRLSWIETRIRSPGVQHA